MTIVKRYLCFENIIRSILGLSLICTGDRRRSLISRQSMSWEFFRNSSQNIIICDYFISFNSFLNLHYVVRRNDDRRNIIFLFIYMHKFIFGFFFEKKYNTERFKQVCTIINYIGHQYNNVSQTFFTFSVVEKWLSCSEKGLAFPEKGLYCNRYRKVKRNDACFFGCRQ